MHLFVGKKKFMDSGRKHRKLRKGKKERKLREGQKLLDCRSFNNPPPKSSTPSDMVLLYLWLWHRFHLSSILGIDTDGDEALEPILKVRFDVKFN